MSKILPANGTHQGRITAPLIVYQTESGALCVAMAVSVSTPEVAWSGKYTSTIVKQDGTIQERSVDGLKKITGWDGTDPFALEEIDVSALDVEVVGEREMFSPRPTANDPTPEQREIFKIQYVNPPGGGGASMPSRLDADARRKILAAHGSKFRALSGGSKAAPAKSAAPAKTAAPAKNAKIGPPPARKSNATSASARTLTQEEAFTLLNDWNEAKGDNKLSEEDLGAKWYAAQEAVREGMSTTAEGTPAEWGKVATELGL